MRKQLFLLISMAALICCFANGACGQMSYGGLERRKAQGRGTLEWKRRKDLAVKQQKTKLHKYLKAGYVICSKEETKGYDSVVVSGPMGNIYMRRK